MPENENAFGEYWTNQSVAILSKFGWQQLGTSNFDIECSCHPQRKIKRHGVDSLFTYYDPYYKSDNCVLIESKTWQFSNFSSSKIRDFFKQITDCMECMQVSPIIQSLSTTPVKNALLMCWANDTYDRKEFVERLKKIRVNAKKYECNVFVASNYEILKWCSLLSAIEKIKNSAKDFKFVYPCVPTLSSNFIAANHLTLVQMFSRYIFANVRIEQTTHNGTIYKDQLIVFSFDDISMASLEFLYDCIRQQNLQNAEEYVFYFYADPIAHRAVLNEFVARINSQRKGDITRSVNVRVDFLDRYDGMTNFPSHLF